MSKVSSNLFPPHLKPLEVPAQKAAEALQKMPAEIRTQILDGIPKTAPDIRANLAHRLLRRNTADLAKLIGEAHLGTTTSTTARVGDLIGGLREGKTTEAAVALASIVHAAGASPQEMAKLKARLQLIAIARSQEGLALLTPPQRAVLAKVGGQDFQQLVTLVQQQLTNLAYQPLLEKVDPPTS